MFLETNRCFYTYFCAQCEGTFEYLLLWRVRVCSSEEIPSRRKQNSFDNISRSSVFQIFEIEELFGKGKIIIGRRWYLRVLAKLLTREEIFLSVGVFLQKDMKMLKSISQKRKTGNIAMFSWQCYCCDYLPASIFCPTYKI